MSLIDAKLCKLAILPNGMNKLAKLSNLSSVNGFYEFVLIFYITFLRMLQKFETKYAIRAIKTRL